MLDNRVVWALLALICGAHAILAISFARVTPYRASGFLLHQGRTMAPDIGAPDERQHANYVQHILDGKGIPVFNPADPNLYESYQAHQPPLYYLVAAGYAKLMGSNDLSDPAQGVPLRYLNVPISIGTIVGVFFLCMWGFRRPDLGLIAAVISGLMPMFVSLTGAIGNDPLLFLMCTWTLALCARGIANGWSPSLAAWAGLLVGLGIVTKTTAIALIPTLFVALWLSAQLRLALVACVPALVLAGIWWTRNVLTLPGFDPLAMNAFTQAFKGSPQASVFIEAFGPYAYWVDMVGWWTILSFFGVFGYMDIFLDQSTYRLLIALMVVLIAAWGFGLRQEEWRAFKKIHWVNGVFTLIIFALFFRFNAQYFQGQARYLYPATAAISTALAIGSLVLVRSRFWFAFAPLAFALCGLDVYVLTMLPNEFMRRV
jgi:4-amino-4-deoxy-L-arabinose transferase-like glycosyltransferase